MGRKIIVGVVAIAASLLTVQLLWGGEPRPAQQPNARVAALRQERVAIAKQALEVLEQQRDKGVGGEVGEFGQWERKLFDAETEAAADRAGRVAAAERYVDSARKRAERVQKMYESGLVPKADVLSAKYDLAGAECALEEAKAR